VTCLGCLAGSLAMCRKSGVATQIIIAAHMFLHVTRAAMLPVHIKSQAVLLALLMRAPQGGLQVAFTGRQQACKLAIRGNECGLHVKTKALSRRSKPQQCSPASGTFLLVASAMRQVHSGAVATCSTSRYDAVGLYYADHAVVVSLERIRPGRSAFSWEISAEMRSARLQGRCIDFLGGRYEMAGLLGAFGTVFMRYLDTCESYFAAAS
jgi:hypothetical protein